MGKAIVYADISPNVVDGSSIWLMSISEVLARIFDEVEVILKMEPQTDVLTSSLEKYQNVCLNGPKELVGGPVERTPQDAAELVAQKVLNEDIEVVLVRGMDACHTFAVNNVVSKKLWSYVTDLQFPPDRLSLNGKTRIERIAARSKALFAQTEAARSYLEAIAPSASGKTFLLPPMLPENAFEESAIDGGDGDSRRLEIIYSGKFAEEWKTLELLELPFELERLGIPARLTVVGAKINKSKRNPQWRSDMEAALQAAATRDSEAIRILGALPRSKSIEEIRAADLGIGWRTQELDGSLEISTKALEYSAARTAPVVNRNLDHVALFGEDYPFFVSADMTVSELAELIARERNQVKSAADKAHGVVEHYSMNSAAERLKRIFDIHLYRSTPENRSAKVVKVVVASHDLKFAGELVRHLEDHPNVNLRFDHWKTLRKHDRTESKKLAQWADIVLCEFAGPNLAFYSQEVDSNTLLCARLHGFEIRNKAAWLKDVNYSAVDNLITVSERYRGQVLDYIPDLAGKVKVIPNIVDKDDLDRPKRIESRFHLGLVGIVPFLKRPDRAVTLLERLLEEDERYYLHIKGRLPWDYPYVWDDNFQRMKYLDLFERISKDPSLKEHVIFEPFSTDIASWLRGIGFVLSPSEEESFHLAPAEGMSSGAIPVVWERAGGEEIFGVDNVYGSLEAMMESILGAREPEEFMGKSIRAKCYSERWERRRVLSQWDKLLKLPNSFSEDHGSGRGMLDG